MATLIESLRTLHRIHGQLADLQDRLQRGPRQVKVAEAAVKKCEGDVTAAKDAHRQAKMASDEKHLQLKQREARLHDLQGKLNASNSNKEFQLLKDQMAADRQANSVLADEILEAMERIDQLHAGIKLAEENLAKTKEEFNKVRKRVEEQQQGLESEHARVDAFPESPRILCCAPSPRHARFLEQSVASWVDHALHTSLRIPRSARQRHWLPQPAVLVSPATAFAPTTPAAAARNERPWRRSH